MLVRRLAVAAAATIAVLAVAPAAHATAVPFDLHYQFEGQSFEAGAGYAAEPGFVGFCGEDTCQGFEVRAEISSVRGTTAPFQATLRGYACFHDAGPACSATGVPFTGLRISERIVDAPEGQADVVFWSVGLCVWRGGWTPGTCTREIPSDEFIGPAETGNLAEPAPHSVGV